jgi:hypothetical protein
MTFRYPKRLWSLPCRYHNGHAARSIDHTLIALSVGIQRLAVWECNIVSEAFKTDYFTFITNYVEDRYDPRIDKLCDQNDKYYYGAMAQFFAFASVTLAVSVTALLDFVDNDILRVEEISYCCLDKKHWSAVKLAYFTTDDITPVG